MIVSAVQRYVAIGTLIALAGVTAWGLRVDHLRGQWKDRAVIITAAIADVAGVDKLSPKRAVETIWEIGRTRDQYKRERDAAKSVIITQTDSINVYEAESTRLKHQSAEYRAEIARLTKQRNHWIAEADKASTRTQRLNAEAEVKICEEAMDGLYDAGF